MKKNIYFLSFLTIFLVAFSSCKKKDPVSITPNKVSQFVYDGMSVFYYWADEVTEKKPTANDNDPKIYFNSILNSLDKKKGWSFITDNVEELLADSSGEPVDFGFSVGLVAVNQAATQYYAYIQYVYPNTPASKAGLDRLDFIGKINDQPITEYNYMELFSSKPTKFTIFKLINNSFVHDRDVTLTPAVNKTDPVLYTKTYEISGKKIGYLFYTSFIGEFNNSLYDAFNEFKTAGVTDLVVDLRYNRGGRSDASIYLASLMAPKAAVQSKSPFVIRDYNEFLNEHFKNRTQHLGDYTASTMKNPLDVNLDLNKVYIIATGGSYSASELVTFCLKEYTDVVHIGGKTGGKFTSSFTIHPYNNFGETVNTLYDERKLSNEEKTLLKNWAIQPIVGMYANHKGENFSNPGYLMPNYELEEGGGFIDYWKPLGDTEDVFLGQAIYLITGDVTYKPQTAPAMSKIKSDNNALNVKLQNRKEAGSGDIVEDIKLTPEDYQKLLEIKKTFDYK